MTRRTNRPEKQAELASPAAAFASQTALVLATGTTIYFAVFVLVLPVRHELLSLLTSPGELIAQWFGTSGTPLGFFDRLPVVGMAALILMAAYGAGGLTFDGLRLAGQATPLERGVFSVAVGLNWLSLLTLGLGLAGLLGQSWLFGAILAGLAGYGFWQVVTIDRDHWSRLWNVQSAIRNPKSAIALAAILFGVLILLGATLPPWDFDVREYHLQVPKEWFQQGRIAFLPHNAYGNMPLGAEMHALLAMTLMPGEQGWFYGALAGKVVIASYAWLTAAALFAAGRRMGSDLAGLVAGAIYLAHPWVVHVSVSGLVDGALAANVFLAAYAAWLSREEGASPLLAGLLAGGAAACKYPGLIFAVAPLAVWLLLPTSGKLAAGPMWLRFGWGAAGLFLVGATIGGGPWYAKNAAQTGNPVYPLAAGVFGPSHRSAEQVAQWERAHQVPKDEHGRRYSPRQMGRSAARVVVLDELASPVVVPLGLVGVVGLLLSFRRTKYSVLSTQHAVRLNSAGLAENAAKQQTGSTPIPAAVLLLLFIAAVWWLASHRLDRFLLPAWPFAALLAGVGAVLFDNRVWRWTAGTILAIGLGYCLLANSSQLVGDNRWFVSLEQLRRDELRVKPTHHWLNENVRPGRAVLLVGDAAPFDLVPRAYYNTCFDSCLLCDWMLGRTAAERNEQLASRNIDWVFVDWPEIRRYQSPDNYGFDPRFDPALIDELLTQGVLGPPIEVVPGDPQAGQIYPVASP